MKNQTFVRIIILSLCSFFYATHIGAQDVVIRHPVGRTAQDQRYEYMIKVLKLVLDKTIASHGQYRLKPSIGMNQERMVRDLIYDKLDVAQLPISEKNGHDLLPIRIPIRKGLLGWRILLIRKEDRGIFSKVKSIIDLQKFKAGFGSTWADLPILEYNIGSDNVVTGKSYDGLFGMLINGRFDYLHRGLHEPWKEVAQRRDQYPDLWIEETLILHYPMGDYLYVNPRNIKLAERLQTGFNLALADGSFEQLFEEEFRGIIDKAKISQRTLIKFNNPNLPEDTPIQNKNLWLSF